MRVVTWNLYHGRAQPPAGRDLLEEFAQVLAEWDWDVALLQEVPPWWGPPLAHAAGAQQRTALTARNAGLWLRRPLARRWPDLMKSGGGGANAILVRGQPILDHRSARLRLLPERRVVHAVRLAGAWVGNLHGAADSEQWARHDTMIAGDCLRRWAGPAPVVLGGDFNLRAPAVAGLVHIAGHSVDHVFVSGLEPAGGGRLLEHEPLSDHVPLLVALQAPGRIGGAAASTPV